MKFVFSAKEVSLITRLVPAYISNPKAIDAMTDTSYRFMPSLIRKMNEDTGELTYEIPENFVIDVTNACHQALHPHVGDLKATCRLIMAAANGISEKLKVSFGKVNKKYEIRYTYKVYEANDPKADDQMIVWIMSTPLNANFSDHIEEFIFRADLEWDFVNDNDRFMDKARCFGTYESKDEAIKAYDTLAEEAKRKLCAAYYSITESKHTSDTIVIEPKRYVSED